MLKNRTNLILLLLSGGVFAWALFGLFSLRFERGDTYAPYSSFRADPTGCKVLYESLDSLNGVEAERLLRPIAEIEDVSETVMLITNVDDIDDLSSIDGLDSYLQRGGNVLVFCAQVKMQKVRNFGEMTGNNKWKRKFSSEEHTEQGQEEEKSSGSKTAVKRDKSCCGTKHKSDEEAECRSGGLEKLLNTINLERRKYPHRMPIAAQVDASMAVVLLPGMEIYSHGYLKFADDRWQQLYSARKQPMMVKAEYGGGTLVISAASYFIANEVMLGTPPVELFSWLIGNRRRVIFNELVHGHSNRHNIAWLVGRYRLPILLFNLLLAMVLFVWRSFFSSVNFQQKQYQSGTGQFSATAGLAKLLRKNISPGELLPNCLQEWRRQRIMTIGRQTDAELLQESDPNGRQLKADYNKIVELINNI
jgi:hypothetical protein